MMVANLLVASRRRLVSMAPRSISSTQLVALGLAANLGSCTCGAPLLNVDAGRLVDGGPENNDAGVGRDSGVDRDSGLIDAGGPAGLPLSALPKVGFDGTWWLSEHIAAVDRPAPTALDVAGISWPFAGAMASQAARFEWRINETSLQGFAVELGEDGFDLSELVAEVPIVEHVHGVTEVDPVTGETLLLRRDDDLVWYERNHVVLDWASAWFAPTDLSGPLDGEPFFVGFSRAQNPLAAVPAFTMQRPLVGDPEWPADAGELIQAILIAAEENWIPACPLELCAGEVAVTVAHELRRIPPLHNFATVMVAPAHAPQFPGTAVVHQGGRLQGTSFETRPPTDIDPLDQDRNCTLDEDCTGVADSTCDPLARRCTRPRSDRTPRQIAWKLGAGFPPHLVRSAFSALAAWNETLMAARRAALGQGLPTRARMACQSADPTGYCFCGADARAPGVDGNDSCSARSDWFSEPEQRGETAPYLCAIVGPPEPSAIVDEATYGIEVYQTRFEGDECVLTLEANPCDVDTAESCVLAGALGSSLITTDVSNSARCASSQNSVDPLTGEILSSTVLLGTPCLEDAAVFAASLWPVLRGEALESSFLSLASVDGAYARLNRAQTRGPKGVEGGLPDPFLGLNDDLLQLADTSAEPVLSSPMQPAGSVAWAELDPVRSAEVGLLDGEARSEALRALTSPARAGLDDFLRGSFERDLALRRAHVQVPRPAWYAARFHQYFARAFTGRGPGEARVRFGQALARGLLSHQLGHALGLEHNLAASLDRNNYPDAWFETVTDANAPSGMALFLVTRPQAGPPLVDNGTWWTQGWAELDAIDNARAEAGLGTTTTASVMDLAGDLGDLNGPGRYDAAAIAFRYFRLVEEFVSDPLYSAGAFTTLFEITRSDVTDRRWLSWPDETTGAAFLVAYEVCADDESRGRVDCTAHDAGETLERSIWTQRQLLRELLLPAADGRFTQITTQLARALYDSAKVGRAAVADVAPGDLSFAGASVVDWLAELALVPVAGSYAAHPDLAFVGPGGLPFDRYVVETVAPTLTLAPGAARPLLDVDLWLRGLALRTLTLRDWGAVSQRPLVEVADGGASLIFRAVVLGQGGFAAPQVVGGDIVFPSAALGTAVSPIDGTEGPVVAEVAGVEGDVVVGPLSSLRGFAAALALAHGLTRGRLAVWLHGSGGAQSIPDLQADGEPTAFFGAAIPGSGHLSAPTPADADYVGWSSSSTPFHVAIKAQERATFNLEGSQLGFRLLLKHQTLNAQRLALEAIAVPTADQVEEHARLLLLNANDRAAIADVLTVRQQLLP